MGKTNYLPNLHILASILPFFCLVMFHMWSFIQACTYLMRNYISHNDLQITVVMTLNYPNGILVEGCTHILIHCSKKSICSIFFQKCRCSTEKKNTWDQIS